MPWTHVLVKNVRKDFPRPGETDISYAIHEFFWDDPTRKGDPTFGEGFAWTADPVDVTADTRKGLRKSLHWMLRALRTPMAIHDVNNKTMSWQGKVVDYGKSEEFDPEVGIDGPLFDVPGNRPAWD